MAIKHRHLSTALLGSLVLSACAQATATPATVTRVTPTPTVKPSPTVRPEKNVALNQPVRVSAYWVVDPPERAVDGNTFNWWGAGGPAPQWIEVDLGALYSVSRIKVISQGPIGQATFRVLGRGMGYASRVLHIFDGYKAENQTLEFSPAEPRERHRMPRRERGCERGAGDRQG